MRIKIDFFKKKKKQVGSRRVIVCSAIIMIIVGCFSKICALFATIPDPVIGANFFCMFGMIAAVGLSNLQFINLNSSRNLFILGFALFSGLSLPPWIEAHPDYVDTGNKEVDQVIGEPLIFSILYQIFDQIKYYAFNCDTLNFLLDK